MGPNQFLPNKIEEILLENLSAAAEMRLDVFRHGPLGVDRPLQRRDHRNTEVAEQAYEISRVRPQARAGATLHLRQEEVLVVDNHPAAFVDDDTFDHDIALQE